MTVHPMRILAIDTSTDVCSVALLHGDAHIELHRHAPQRQAEFILPDIEAVLAQGGTTLRALDGLAFGCGPGAFTGVRIAAGVIQALALAADLPVAPISTLAAIAHGCARRHGVERVLAALDARMNELYLGTYAAGRGHVVALAEDAVGDARTLPLPAQGRWFGAGAGWAVAQRELQGRLGPLFAGMDAGVEPHASDIAELGRTALLAGCGTDAAGALPHYLRDRVTDTR
ncbi:MAG: tRNA (adenosine(37)-N6)-threonylcarbamoyltransferase complex dimerization subunit type 1 TsaB [Gammaproteobacteria bacterium]